jgi:hypothetical protein
MEREAEDATVLATVKLCHRLPLSSLIQSTCASGRCLAPRAHEGVVAVHRLHPGRQQSMGAREGCDEEGELGRRAIGKCPWGQRAAEGTVVSGE